MTPGGGDVPRGGGAARTHQAPLLLALFAPVTAFLAVGCGPDGEMGGWTTEVDTLADGTVQVVNQPPGEDPRPTWRLEEDLRIGAVEGGGPATFGELKGLAVTGNGRIAVLDAQAREIRVFSRDGAHLATHGGQGSGPGELSEPYGLMLGPEGRLWVPDNSANRMSVFDPDSGFVDSWPFPVLLYGYIWGGAMMEDGRVWKPSLTRNARRDLVLRVYGPEMTLEDSLPLAPRPEVDPEDRPAAFYYEAPDGSRRGFRGVPWYPRGDRVLDPSGVIWSTDAGNPAYRIKRWTPGRDTTRVIETRRPLVPVTDAERDSAIDAIREDLRPYNAADQDWSKIPEVKPAVTAMFVAEDGRIWVRFSHPEADSLVAYDVYERDGRLVGTAMGALDPQDDPDPVVRGERMWAVVTDELGVDHVVRARIVPAEEGGNR